MKKCIVPSLMKVMDYKENMYYFEVQYHDGYDDDDDVWFYKDNNKWHAIDKISGSSLAYKRTIKECRKAMELSKEVVAKIRLETRYKKGLEVWNTLLKKGGRVSCKNV